MIFLFDTNTLIHGLAGVDPYASLLESHIKDKSLSLSVITVSEFLSGVTGREELVFKSLLQKVNVLPVDVIVAETAANYRKEFNKKTKKVWLFDCLIAATAKVYGAILVTSDKHDYPMKDIQIHLI
jgi:predicted nucleic acid-binding protein